MGVISPIRGGAFRWSTPDPADDWMMVGHLFVRESGVVFVDPPLVPGLVEAAERLGKPEAVLLTTQNHIRGSNYISKRTGIRVYLPEQIPDAVDSAEAVKVKQLGNFEVYKADSVLGFRTYKFIEDYALLSNEKELLVGDNAAGDGDGKVALWPYWYLSGPPYSDPSSQAFKDRLKGAFKEIVKNTGAASLLASHGYDVYGSLQEQASNL
jgi:hypothetical protein